MLADIPGLIEGAHGGAGLGDRFLGHVERCRVLLHLVDATLEDVAGAYQTIRRELEAYDHGLTEKLELVALNKADAVAADDLADRRRALAEVAGGDVLVCSGATGRGVEVVLRRLMVPIATARAPAAEPEQRPWTP